MSSPSARTGSGSGTFRPDIQGLRAIAVLLVVIYHAGVPGLTGGYVGVDVFFVISGFLITGHLLKSLRETGRLEFGHFYARRARRILPASFVVLVATAIAAVFLASPLRLEAILRDGIATALYVPNLYFAVQQTDYLADASPSPFQHYWSLGVEEQFYLLWPLLLLLAFLLFRRRQRRVAIAIAVIVVASFAACVVLGFVSQPWAFFSLPTRAWELGIGGLVAMAGTRIARMPPALAAIGGWAGLTIIVVSGFVFTADTHYPGVTTALPVLGAALLLACGATPSRFGPTALLSWRPFQFVGLISYSLYLVHWPILVLASARSDAPLPLPVSVALAASAVPLAWLLYRFVEAPFRDRSFLRRRTPRTTLWGAAAASVSMVLALVVAGPAVANVPMHSDRVAPLTALAPLPAGTPYVPANLSPTIPDAIDDTGVLYTNGCQQAISRSAAVRCTFGNAASPFRIVLFGDSHAGRWFPALEAVAEARNIRLDTYTKSACHSEDLVGLWDYPGTCSDWRASVIAALAKDPPNVIVLVNHLGLSAGKDPASVREEWDAGIASSLARLPSSSLVVTIADTPEFASAPASCLSVHLNDALACAGSRDAMFNAPLVEAQREESAKAGAVYLDLSDYFCSATTCPAIIGPTLVYADEHHLTATFTRRLGVPLERGLSPYLPPR